MLGYTYKIAVAALLLPALVACGEQQEAVVVEQTRPVKTFVVEGGSGNTLRSFPGRVDASKRAELSFRVPGRLQEILVKEGDLVEEGEVLARLDPTDYQLIYEDRKATFDNSKSNFNRAKDLVADGNISRMDYDKMEANYRTASAALSQAEQDLEYTVLKSPFQGRVAERKAEKFEEVLAKQTVFSLQNTSTLDIIIDVPESVVRMVRKMGDLDRSIESNSKVSATSAYAEFQGHSNEKFPLTPKEIATKANSQTQTFKTTFTMESPTDFTVLPGMTTTVVLDLSNLIGSDGGMVRRVPVRAVQGDAGLQSRVWVLDSDTMTVSAQPVTIGRMSGDLVEVTSGLNGGEEIVSVGAPYLAEGMKVSRMAVTEQAVPRPGEPL